MTDFFTALQSHKNDAGLPPHVRRVINMRNSNRRGRIVARMEDHAKVHIGVETNTIIDWSNPPNLSPMTGAAVAAKFNWAGLLKFLETVLPMILALFGL